MAKQKKKKPDQPTATAESTVESTTESTTGRPATVSAAQIERALRAFVMRGRASAEVLRLNDAELADFAKLVTKDLQPAGDDFAERFSELWTAHRKRVDSAA